MFQQVKRESNLKCRQEILQTDSSMWFSHLCFKVLWKDVKECWLSRVCNSRKLLQIGFREGISLSSVCSELTVPIAAAFITK